MQAELTSIWQPTGVQEENVPCEEKKTKQKKRDTQCGWKSNNNKQMDNEFEERNHKKEAEEYA